MPAASSIIGQCPDCCACPAPILQWDSRTVSLSKTGWTDNVNGVPIYYLTFTASGTLKQTRLDGSYNERRYTGSLTYDPATGTFSGGIESCFRQGFSAVDGPWECAAFFPSLGNPPGVFGWSFGGAPWPGIDASYVATRTNDVLFSTIGPPTISGGPPFAPASDITTGENRFEVSNLYTTETLINSALEKLAAIDWDDDWNDTPGSSRNLSDDGASMSVRDSRFRWLVPPHKVGNGKRYVVRWVERFTPEAPGGEVVDTERCAAWDGVLPEGYDPEAQTTWPVLGPFDYAVPEEDGERTVGYYATPDDPESFVALAGLAACRGTCPEEESP